MRLGAILVIASSVLWAQGARAQQLGGGGGGTDISMVRILAALAVCCAAAFALAIVLRKRSLRPGAGKLAGAAKLGWLGGAFTGSSRIQVIESRRLSPFADISLVRCDGTEYLLASGPGGHQILRSRETGLDSAEVTPGVA
jgi:hypothetical protein